MSLSSIKHDSNLSPARLLRPLIDSLGDLGAYMSGQGLSQAIQRPRPGGLVYGPRNMEGSGDYSLDISGDIRLRADWPNRRHPEGRYL